MVIPQKGEGFCIILSFGEQIWDTFTGVLGNFGLGLTFLSDVSWKREYLDTERRERLTFVSILLLKVLQ